MNDKWKYEIIVFSGGGVWSDIKVYFIIFFGGMVLGVIVIVIMYMKVIGMLDDGIYSVVDFYMVGEIGLFFNFNGDFILDGVIIDVDLMLDMNLGNDLISNVDGFIVKFIDGF